MSWPLIKEAFQKEDELVLEEISKHKNKMSNEFKEIETMFKEFKSKADKTTLDKLCNYLQTKSGVVCNKENDSVDNSKEKKITSTRTTRQSSRKDSRPTLRQEVPNNRKIKLERISTIEEIQDENISPLENIKLEDDTTGNMLPPPVPKKRGRKKKDPTIKAEPTRARSTRIKKERSPSPAISEGRNSDVIFEQNQVSVLIIDEECEPEVRRSTRTKTKKPDAPIINNETVIIQNPIDQTRIIYDPLLQNNDPNFNLADLMTDDESENEEIQKKPVTSNKPNNSYESSPVKKRVEAFEKLVAVEAPTRMTRTKKKNQEALDNIEGNEKHSSNIPVKINSYLTPLRNKIVLSGSKTTSKIPQSPLHTITCNPKTASALKASHKTFTEREEKRKKEEEATRKKELQIQAEMEEKRRRRQEREQKVKQTREEIEREKLKLLDTQKQRELKQQELLREKQEKQERQRQDNEKKRLLVKQKSDEKRILAKAEYEKKKLLEESQKPKIDVIQKPENRKKAPVYMTEKAPFLPSFDCYDSDDERSQNKKIPKPLWAKSEMLSATKHAMMYIDDKIKNTLFYLKPQTPDLRELFENVDSKMLHRNSSAIWKTAPRFTMMPEIQQ